MRILKLKQILFTSEVMVENDLFFEVVRHVVANAIGFVDALCDGLVARSELVESLHLFLEVVGLEEVVTFRVGH